MQLQCILTLTLVQNILVFTITLWLNAMFDRTILNFFNRWAASRNRKPLVLRGARQTGKTTAVKLWGKNFESFLYFNLDLSQDLKLFEQAQSFDLLLESLFFTRNESRSGQRCLIFIDEIQNSPKAVAWLRYFYEEAPDLFVIAAGSLLESAIDRHISFPVGRVEYYVLRPLSFREFLKATGENRSAEIMEKLPLPDHAFEPILTQFAKYMVTGGMPEAVAQYAENRDFILLKSVFSNLITGYIDDIEKYAKRGSQLKILRHTANSIFGEAGKRIKFSGFGESNYGSRDIKSALEMLQKAFLIHLVYPSTDWKLPALPSMKKSPRLHVFDTGLLLHSQGLQHRLLQGGVANVIWKGTMVEHMVGQEILAGYTSPLDQLRFWTREKKQSNAEVDYILATVEGMIPVEVKSGPTGRLRSLHQFMDMADHNKAVRLYAGPVRVDNVKTISGKPFQLLNLPYFLAGKLGSYIDWFISGRQ